MERERLDATYDRFRDWDSFDRLARGLGADIKNLLDDLSMEFTRWK